VTGLCAALWLGAVTPLLPAQERIPKRPELPAAADTNNWEAYYDAGVEWLNNREHANAEAAFYWSSRLNPRRAEPLFARYTTAWARDIQRFGRYLQRDPEKPLAEEMQRIDSLRYRAVLRNPLVFQGGVIAPLMFFFATTRVRRRLARGGATGAADISTDEVVAHLQQLALAQLEGKLT